MYAHASVVKYIGVAYENSRHLACRLEGAKFISHRVHSCIHGVHMSPQLTPVVDISAINLAAITHGVHAVAQV